MTENEVLENAFAMPLASPSYPCGPYRLVDREFFIITYRSDRETLAQAVPAPLELAEHALAPLTRVPAYEIVSAQHILTALTLALGAVAHVHLAE